MGRGVIGGDVVSSWKGVSITAATATADRCRGVWIGTTQSLDFSFDGTTWVTFQGATAGTIIPIQVNGARKTSGAAAPTAGDVVFLY
jgi:hypothetical protein